MVDNSLLSTMFKCRMWEKNKSCFDDFIVDNVKHSMVYASHDSKL